MNFVAEWFSHGEMKVLQGVSLLMSVWVREWQYKDVLPDFDSQMWEDQSEEWQKYMSEKKKKVLPCENASAQGCTRSDTMCLLLKTSGKPKSSRAGAGGTERERGRNE